MDYFKELEDWAAKLGYQPKKIPTLIKMRQEVFAELINNAPESTKQFSKIYRAKTRLDAVNIQVDEDIDCKFIVFDQNGEEMMRK